MKYAVAIFSHHEGENRMLTVEATNPAGAAKKALIEHCPKKFRDKMFLKWVDDMPDNASDIINLAADGELSMTFPELI